MLYLVATPIGNLADITFRALETFRNCGVIVAEDSRRIGILLKTYDIKDKKIIVYNEHNEKRKTPDLITLLEEGTDIALTTDAGTPSISDPGFLVVREAVKRDIPVTSIPGPCAFVSALICSGFPVTSFEFTGFIPRKSGKKKTFLENITKTTVFYESPHRIIKTLGLMAEVIPERQIVIGRELTKKFEEFIRGTALEVYKKTKDRKLKGEITVIIA